MARPNIKEVASAAGISTQTSSRVIKGMAAAAEKAGYSLLLKKSPFSDKYNVRPIFQALLSRHVDGIIWTVPEFGENHSRIHDAPFDMEDIGIVKFDNIGESAFFSPALTTIQYVDKELPN
jgi:DNA-binding LacI/PurR family transcriptional regulator